MKSISRFNEIIVINRRGYDQFANALLTNFIPKSIQSWGSYNTWMFIKRCIPRKFDVLLLPP